MPPSDFDGTNPPPTVAADFAALTSCVGATTPCLQHAIDRPADGSTVVVEAFPVWTGTLQNGASATDICGGWTGAGLGVRGIATAIDGNWTNSQTADCLLGSGSLYCFEQA